MTFGITGGLVSLNQDQVILVLLKIGVICGFVSLVSWVGIYIRLTRWGALRNPIGRTLVIKTLLIAFLLIPTTLSLFFQLNRLDSRITAWVDVALIGAITPVMVWRSAVWLRESRRPGLASADPESAEPTPGHEGADDGAS